MTHVQQPDAASERARLHHLRGYGILDTVPEPRFDDIAALAAHLCGTPVALVGLFDADRHWFKARVGFAAEQVSRELSLCAHTLHSDAGQVVQVPDTASDPRFAGHPLVLGDPQVRFYAGTPLVDSAGFRLGTLSVADHVPRHLTAPQRQGLVTLARHVVVELDLHRRTNTVEAANLTLREADRLKDEFIARVSHELRTPLTSIQGYLEMLDDDDLPASSVARFLGTIRRNSDRLIGLVDDMIFASQGGGEPVRLALHRVDLAEVAREAAAQHRRLAQGRGLDLVVRAPASRYTEADPALLAQAVNRVVRNAIKFTESGSVSISVQTGPEHDTVEVTDTGVGIDPQEQARLFAPFRRASTAEASETPGAGLGLSIVRTIMAAHGGSVSLDSSPHRGTTVRLTVPRPTGQHGSLVGVGVGAEAGVAAGMDAAAA